MKISSKNVVESPKDAILEGVITEVSEKSTWREHLTAQGNEKSIDKFPNPDQEIINISYVVKGDESLTGFDTVAYYNKPKDRSKLGKLLMKYGDLDKGTVIKIQFDGEGYSSIVNK